jgi:LacI family transcriptional regulator
LDLLVQERVRGVLITAIDYNNDRLRSLPAVGVPVVLVDRAAKNEDRWCSVGVDDRAGGRLAVTHLLDTGHRRIAFAGGPQTIPQVVDRLHGAKQAIRSARRPADTLTVIETTGLNVAQGRNVGERLMGMPQRNRPTAVFCANDLLALGVLQHLTQQGLAVPDDIAIVGYDDIDFAAAAAVPLTSVRQPRHQLGRTAIDLIMRDSADDPHEHQQIQFMPELIVRSSSGLRRAQRVSRVRATAAAR